MLLVLLRSRPQRMGLVAAPRRARAAAPSSLCLPPRGSTNVAQVMRLGLHLGGGEEYCCNSFNQLWSRTAATADLEGEKGNKREGKKKKKRLHGKR